MSGRKPSMQLDPMLPVNPCPFNVGDEVNCAGWNRTVPPSQKMGDCVVIRTVPRLSCASGWMIVVESAPGRTLMLDADWLEGVEGAQSRREPQGELF